METFVGRERELKELEAAYGKPSAFMIYGRRRIGKTTLIEHFCQGKRMLYLNCLKSGMSENLEQFAEIIARFTGREAGPYRKYKDVFDDLSQIAAESTTVIVIDEYQFLVMESAEVSTYLQDFIDRRLKKTTSMLIVSGSSVGIMRHEVEDGKNPLFGRFNKIHLGPLTFRECDGFHPGMDDMDRLRLYVSFGGIPLYHEMMSEDTYDECIKNRCLSSDWVPEEVASMVESEFSRPGRIMAILSAISHGAVGLKRISERARADDSLCLKDLDTLEYVGLVGTVKPMFDAPKKAKMYVVKDSLFAFNFEIMDRSRDARRFHDKSILLKELSSRLSTFMGKRFEMFCVDLIRENYIVDSIGKWWVDRDGAHEEIDIVAESTMGGNKYVILAECKFRNAPTGFTEYNELVRRSRRFDGYNTRLMMISASGFDVKMAEFARDEGVMLVGPDEIFGRSPMPELR